MDVFFEIGYVKHWLQRDQIYLVGRKGSKANPYIQIDCTTIDDKHAIFYVTAESVNIIDLQSTNGTFINGHLIPSMEKIEIHGEKNSLRFGKSIEGYLFDKSTKNSLKFVYNTPEEPKEGCDLFAPETQIDFDAKNRSRNESKTTRSNIEDELDDDNFYVPETEEILHIDSPPKYTETVFPIEDRNPNSNSNEADLNTPSDISITKSIDIPGYDDFYDGTHCEIPLPDSQEVIDLNSSSESDINKEPASNCVDCNNSRSPNSTSELKSSKACDGGTKLKDSDAVLLKISKEPADSEISKSSIKLNEPDIEKPAEMFNADEDSQEILDIGSPPKHTENIIPIDEDSQLVPSFLYDQKNQLCSYDCSQENNEADLKTPSDISITKSIDTPGYEYTTNKIAVSKNLMDDFGDGTHCEIPLPDSQEVIDLDSSSESDINKGLASNCVDCHNSRSPNSTSELKSSKACDGGTKLKDSDAVLLKISKEPADSEISKSSTKLNEYNIQKLAEIYDADEDSICSKKVNDGFYQEESKASGAAVGSVCTNLQHSKAMSVEEEMDCSKKGKSPLSERVLKRKLPYEEFIHEKVLVIPHDSTKGPEKIEAKGSTYNQKKSSAVKAKTEKEACTKSLVGTFSTIDEPIKPEKAAVAAQHLSAQENAQRDDQSVNKCSNNDDRFLNQSSTATKCKYLRSTGSTKGITYSEKKSLTEETAERLKSVPTMRRLRSADNSVLKKNVAFSMVDQNQIATLVKKAAGLVVLVNDVQKSDILIMTKGCRTYKFLFALANSLPIVSAKWLDKVAKTKSLTITDEDYLLDTEFEKKYKFSLKKAYELSKTKKVLEQCNFLVTPNISPNPEETKRIIITAGGKVIQTVPFFKADQKLYLVTCHKDTLLWHKYRRQNINLRIIDTEAIMQSLMHQNADMLQRFRLT